MKNPTQKPITAVNQPKTQAENQNQNQRGNNPESRSATGSKTGHANETNTYQTTYSSKEQANRYESGVLSRTFLVVMLSLTLVGVLRWALNVTNANARQISSNLTRIQGHYADEGQSANAQSPNSWMVHPTGGPIIEPATRDPDKSAR